MHHHMSNRLARIIGLIAICLLALLWTRTAQASSPMQTAGDETAIRDSGAFTPTRYWYAPAPSPEMLGLQSVTIGDVNGDGYADLAVNSLGDMMSLPSRVLVYYGGPDGLPQSDGVADPPQWEQTAADWWTLFEQQLAAIYVAGIGDVNGDGYDDLAVTTLEMNSGENGRLLVYAGGADGLATSPTVLSIDPENQRAAAVRAHPAGDVNGDGFADVVIFVQDGQTDLGYFALHLGSTDGLEPDHRWRTESFPAYEEIAAGFAGLDDINGDGYDDVLAGLSGHWNPGGTGRVRIYLGSAAGLDATAAWSRFGTADAAFLGRAIAATGDMNGDGYADFAVADGSGNRSGRILLYLGGPEMQVRQLTNDDNFIQFAVALAAAGDVNGDGYDDLAVSSRSGSEEQTIQLFLGAPDGVTAEPGFTFTSDVMSDFLPLIQVGASSLLASDVDGDGVDDLALGGFYMYDSRNRVNPDVGQYDMGAALLFYGTAAEDGAKGEVAK